VENRAIGLTDSPAEQAEIKKIVDRIRQKYNESGD